VPNSIGFAQRRASTDRWCWVRQDLGKRCPVAVLAKQRSLSLGIG